MKIGLIFPGQGSQFVGMGYELYKAFSEAKECFQEADEILGRSLSALMFQGDAEELRYTNNAQLAIFVHSVAAFRVLQKQLWPHAPSPLECVMAGHSLGEYSALHIGGAFSFAEALDLIKVRGEAMRECAEGGMIALVGVKDIGAAERLAEAANARGVCEIANDNGAGQVILSGEAEALEFAISAAGQYGIVRAMKLSVSGAFHSALMRPAAEKLAAALENADVKRLDVPVISNVTAKEYPADPAQIKQLLGKQVTASVRWRESMERVRTSYKIRASIEIGPCNILSNLLKRSCQDIEIYSLSKPEDLEKIVLV